MKEEGLLKTVNELAGCFKLYCAVGNNAAWAACLEAHDHVQEHRNYRHRTRRLFRLALEEFRAYERQLLHTDRNRMFHVDDLEPESRRKYGDITDRDYYDMWAAVGSTAYADTRHLVTSLQNKYRLSLEGHGIRQSGTVAWAMAAQACLELACQMHESIGKLARDEFGIPERVCREVFGQFSLRRTASAWHTALMSLDAAAGSYALDAAERRNIALGIEQLQEAWTSPHVVNGATATTVEAYDDVFRTRGEQKKTLRYIADVNRRNEEKERHEREERINERRHELAAAASVG